MKKAAPPDAKTGTDERSDRRGERSLFSKKGRAIGLLAVIGPSRKDQRAGSEESRCAPQPAQDMRIKYDLRGDSSAVQENVHRGGGSPDRRAEAP